MATQTDRLAVNGGTPVTDQMIPLVCVRLEDDEIQAATEVLRSGALRDGSHCRQFETAFATATDAKHGLVCSNGTTALQLAYEALIQPGDEVLCPGYTFIATASMLLARGAVPVLCEVDPNTFNIDVADAASRITDRTRAIAPVHLYGNPCDTVGIARLAQEHGLRVIYDAAQSHLARVDDTGLGAFGDAVTYSFYPTKNMTTGEGGMVTVNDPELAERIALIRDHGMMPGKRYHHVTLGYNYRSTDMAASIGLLQLQKLPERTARRQQVAGRLIELLQDVPQVRVPHATSDSCEHVYHQFTIRLALEQLSCSRDAFAEALRAEGVSSAVHYPKALTEQPVMQEYLGARLKSLPVSEQLAQEVLCLPCHHGLSDAQVNQVGEAVAKVAQAFA
ncbi:MAG: DegT/DnrJ/EryC1/StrS family aminotransferase [Planctomycetes bacterium]|nr:DegT/DnrJ/EryC1/StrS family aminotransferase [Planctomycetota bacterium]NOG53011.1 DegT/DnrJ/EryC1/StrS family aminotransferase [Planctomycetota bacterium]